MEANDARVAETYTFYHDPGHGWLRVPLEEVRALDLDISAYSYMDNEYAYLEEDCDATKFVDAVKGDLSYREWSDANEIDKYNGGFIRHMHAYQASAPSL